jgi:membrane fusion protein (multidrug efflux system)
MNSAPFRALILASFSFSLLPACDTSQAQEQGHQEEEHQKIVATTPISKDVVNTQEYVCQIHSRRHIEIRALENGYLEEIHVSEGQTVKKGDLLFKVLPILYQAKLETEQAHAEVEKIKYDNTSILSNKSIVSNQELALAKAELVRAQAQVKQAQAELNFTMLRAPFDGIIDRQREQQGSLVEEGDVLSTLSDNSLMWVYFNVPEARYLQYKARSAEDLKIELKLANGEIFSQPGKIGAIEADFNNETGNISFRADFANPDSLLRHGQTGTILMHRITHNAIVIPQRATYEILAKKYVFVIEPDSKQGSHEGQKTAESGHEPAAEHGAAHAAQPAAGHAAGHQTTSGVIRQREIIIQDELDDIYVIKEGLGVNDKIVFEGIRQVKDGDKVEYELEAPEKILSNLKYHAE